MGKELQEENGTPGWACALACAWRWEQRAPVPQRWAACFLTSAREGGCPQTSVHQQVLSSSACSPWKISRTKSRPWGESGNCSGGEVSIWVGATQVPRGLGKGGAWHPLRKAPAFFLMLDFWAVDVNTFFLALYFSVKILLRSCRKYSECLHFCKTRPPAQPRSASLGRARSKTSQKLPALGTSRDAPALPSGPHRLALQCFLACADLCLLWTSPMYGMMVCGFPRFASARALVLRMRTSCPAQCAASGFSTEAKGKRCLSPSSPAPARRLSSRKESVAAWSSS